MKSVDSSSAPPVTVIIVAWNQLEKTLACLATVAALDYSPIHTILVDNGNETEWRLGPKRTPTLRSPTLEAAAHAIIVATAARRIA